MAYRDEDFQPPGFHMGLLLGFLGGLIVAAIAFGLLLFLPSLPIG